MSGQVRVQLTEAERRQLGNAKHQCWHGGCTRECGDRLDDYIQADRVIAPVVETILTERLTAVARDLLPHREAVARAIYDAFVEQRRITSSDWQQPAWEELPVSQLEHWGALADAAFDAMYPAS